jgi:hypothetical protein
MPALGTGNFSYGVTGTAWTFTPANGIGGSGITSNDSPFTGDQKAPEGDQVAFLQGNGTISQSAADWSAGSYQISFQAAQRDNSGVSRQDFQVLVDGNVVGAFTPAGTAYQTYTTASFTVAAGSHTITFRGLDSAGGDNTSFLDAVTTSVMTSPLSLYYTVNSASGDNPYTYQVVGPNNAMVSAAPVLDGNWHEAALVVNGNSERLYLDGLLVGAAQAADYYSLGFSDPHAGWFVPTGAAFLGGAINPLPVSEAARPPGVGYPAGFVGSIDEFRVWSVARTQAQIEQAMDAPSTPGPDTFGLLGYYDFTPLKDSGRPLLERISSRTSAGTTYLQFANGVLGPGFGPATTDPAANGTSLSVTDIASVASTIPADPFVGVPRLPGYRDFAPYLAVPYSNSAPTVNLAASPNQVEYQVTLAVGDTVLAEILGGQKVDGPIRVDFLGFTTNPADHDSHPVLASYPDLAPISGNLAISDLIKNNMAAAFVAPASGTYLIRITGPAKDNDDNSAVDLQFSVLPGDSNSLLTLMGTQAVQGGGGTSVASYVDPAAPPGATIDQLLPTDDPQVAEDQQTAYQALVKAAKDYVSANYPSESFTDFLNVNTGVTITPQHLFGLQTIADNAVMRNPQEYLGTANPSPGLLSALEDVLGLLNHIDSSRQNVYKFLQVQDSWIQNEINNILGQNTLSTIAQTIVHNQAQDNPPPYLLPPPPSTPYSIAADVGIQAGRAALSLLQGLLSPLLFAGPAAPLGTILNGLLNIGVSIGATYGTDILKQTTPRYPTLVVPPDKNQVSSLIQAASTYQTQLINSLNAQQNLANEPQYFYPLFSNVGLLDTLQYLNPLVLGSSKAGDQLGPNNPTSAAVASAAWQALLPNYFHWVPIDPTTESTSRNFDNFYPGAIPASPGDALDQLEAMQSGLAYQYPGFSQTQSIVVSGDDRYRGFPPTSMATSPAGSASPGATAHPERFYSLVTAELTEGASGVDTIARNIAGSEYLEHRYFNFSYRGSGLYVVGWELVDANGVEIDPRTAAMVFPTGGAIQPATSGPALLPFGGGWYLNVAAPSPLPSDGGSLYQIQVNPSVAYIDWFHQSTLVPGFLAGNMTVGALDTGDNTTDNGLIQTSAPSYAVSFSTITSVPPADVAVAVVPSPTLHAHKRAPRRRRSVK